MTNVSDFVQLDFAPQRDRQAPVQMDIPHVSTSLFASGKSRVAKRAFDIVVASCGIIFLSPLILLVGLAVYLLDGSPIFISHRRLGLGGRSFSCFKFRSMKLNPEFVLKRHLDANPTARREWEANHKLKNDPRITPLGRVLRKTSLDELPQLINILRGEMSLVGPRPIVAEEAVKYGHNIVDYFSVHPGLTGMWQVSGRSETTYNERVMLDVAYARRRTFAKDLAILFKTVSVVVTSKGSY